LPERLPTQPVWRKPLPSPGLGGVAATDQVVIVSARDLNDSHDFWRGIDPSSGETRWTLRYPAPGNLDFGASPRATALIYDGLAYCYGALGHLHAVNISSGRVVWKHDTQAEFGAATNDLPWGHCGSPLVVADKLVFYAGGPDAALVALDLKTGALKWKTAGAKSAYGSFLAATLGGVEQVVGFDETTLGGWDAETGRRLWTVTPAQEKDFNVPTPIVWDGRLIVSTENNGTRLYGFRPGGVIDPKPQAVDLELGPDTHTPVRIGSRLFGVQKGLHCLDLSSGLRRLWRGNDEALDKHVTAVASDTRLLLITHNGEGILVDATAEKFMVLDRQTLAPNERDLYAHPAFANGRMYLRTSDAVLCYELK
jgi:outer membrane protein assembly factor BamB